MNASNLPPIEALEWLQNVGGLPQAEAEAWREELKAEHEAQACIED